MKRTALGRYDRDAAGCIVIDVAATRAEDLYNDFDKSAPFTRRDLDPDLVDYLIACARELRGEPFVVRFSLQSPLAEGTGERIRRSVKAYFHYLVDGERGRTLAMLRRSALLLGIGLGLLWISLSVNRALGPSPSVGEKVLSEGLTVAAWVSLWESLAIFLIEWFPHRRSIRLYRRLATAEVVFGPASATSATSS